MATAVLTQEDSKAISESGHTLDSPLAMMGRSRGTLIVGAVLGLLSWVAIATLFFVI